MSGDNKKRNPPIIVYAVQNEQGQRRLQHPCQEDDANDIDQNTYLKVVVGILRKEFPRSRG